MSVIKAVLFDFGGVLAEEGFREGLKAVAEMAGLDPERFFAKARKLVYDCGYTSGRATEAEYWRRLREQTQVELTDAEMRAEILRRFVLRPAVLDFAGTLRARGLKTAILTDQTNWIEEINARTPFYGNFDYVFNSFRISRTKRDPAVFTDVCRIMGVEPPEALFIDDNPGHVSRAASVGLATILFTDVPEMIAEAEKVLGDANGRGADDDPH